MLIAFHGNCSPQSKIFCKTSVFLAKASPSGMEVKLCLPGHLLEETKSWQMEGTEWSVLVDSVCDGWMQGPSNRDRVGR